MSDDAPRYDTTKESVEEIIEILHESVPLATALASSSTTKNSQEQVIFPLTFSPSRSFDY